MAQSLEFNGKTYPVLRQEEGTRGSFYLDIDGVREAEMTYSLAHGAPGTPSRIIIDHTGVNEKLRGKSAGKKLVTAAVEWARETGMTILPLCPFARAVFQKTPEFKDVWN